MYRSLSYSSSLCALLVALTAEPSRAQAASITYRIAFNDALGAPTVVTDNGPGDTNLAPGDITTTFNGANADMTVTGTIIGRKIPPPPPGVNGRQIIVTGVDGHVLPGHFQSPAGRIDIYACYQFAGPGLQVGPPHFFTRHVDGSLVNGVDGTIDLAQVRYNAVSNGGCALTPFDPGAFAFTGFAGAAAPIPFFHTQGPLGSAVAAVDITTVTRLVLANDGDGVLLPSSAEAAVTDTQYTSNTGSDACASALANNNIGTVTGAVMYDLTAATTGTEGQTSFTGGYCNYGCAEYGTAQAAVLRDVWFVWMAPSTGTMRITTCSNQNDTKIAIYSGTTCPTGTVCLNCNDDYHYTTGGLLDSILYTPVTAGQQYLIQVGQSSYSGAVPGFPGTFNIDMDPPHETGAAPFDDNQAEVNFSFGAVGDGHLGMNRYANATDVTTLSGMQVCWGWAGSTGWVPGTPAYVGLWADGPSQDGDPTDATLIESVATTIQSPGTDTYVTIPFASNHTVNGIYFLGYGSQRVSSSEFPVSADNSTCNIQPRTAWRVQNVGAPVYLSSLAANSSPPALLEVAAGCQAQGAFSGIYHSAFAIRANLVSGPPTLGTPECFGNTAALCPCNGAGGSGIPNPGAAGHGCANTSFPGGALLSATGNAVNNVNDTVVLTCSDMTGPGLFIQSNGLLGPFVNFNDGNLCAASGIIRMGVVFPTGGVASYPGGLTPNPVHIAGAPVMTPNPTKHYQCWYRDVVPGFCNTQPHNLSNGISIVWSP